MSPFLCGAALPAPPADRIHAATSVSAKSARSRTSGEHEAVETAVVYCEANFGAIDGKTANGLVRYSEKYKILAVIDSEKAGLDSGVVLGEEPNAIPVCPNLAAAIRNVGRIPD